MSRFHIVKPSQKGLHYTVTPIGGPNELMLWRKNTEIKQAQWDAGKETRYQESKTRALHIINGGTPNKDKNKQIFEEYVRKQREAEYIYMKHLDIKKSQQIQAVMKISIFQRLLNWFLNLKFTI